MSQRHRHTSIQPREDPDCGFSDLNRGYLPQALDGISHYHLAHTSDVVTRFVTETVDYKPKQIVHVYVCSDDEARRAFAKVGEQFGMKPIPLEFK